MRNWIMMFALLAALCFSTLLSAQGVAQPKGEAVEGEEGEEEAEEADPLEGYKAMFKDIDGIIGKTAVTEATIKAYLDHTKSFEAAMKGDKEWEKIKEKNLKEAFDYALKSEKAIAWAKEKAVELDGWLRGSLRVMVLTFRAQVSTSVEEQKEMLASQRKALEEMKSELSGDEYKEYVTMLDEGDKSLKDWQTMVDGMPKGTEAEDKLIADNSEKISKAMEDDEEEGGNG